MSLLILNYTKGNIILEKKLTWPKIKMNFTLLILFQKT